MTSTSYISYGSKLLQPPGQVCWLHGSVFFLRNYETVLTESRMFFQTSKDGGDARAKGLIQPP